jgi:acetyl-CoA C-acetyltransferase
MSESSIVIVAAKRTPMGGFVGSLAPMSATELGACAIQAVLEDTQNSSTVSSHIDEVIMGCVLPAGLGQSPARQASLKAGLPLATGVTTINKVCGSGMKALMLAHDLIKAGTAEAIVAGGMESMSNAPYLLPKARTGYRMGHGQVIDHMMMDGLENAYDGQAMGCFAQATADAQHITREQMDEFALASLHKANIAQDAGLFVDEITPVTIKSRKGDLLIDSDDGPKQAKPEKITSLRPAFKKDGTVTPLARIVAHSSHAIEPENFTIAPVGAMQKLFVKTGWTHEEVDLFEINEAFAMVTMLAIKDLGLDPDKVNIKGGACALGHPIGASGARIIVTLLHALKQNNLKKGIASLCIGGGEATAIAFEMM